MLPPALLRLIRYEVHDQVQTIYGIGRIEEIISSQSPRRELYYIYFSSLHIYGHLQAGFMMPYLPPFDPNVFPKKTRVICSKGESGKIIQSKVVDQVVYYDIELDASGERILEQEHSHILLAPGVRIQTESDGNGQILHSNASLGNYEIILDSSKNESKTSKTYTRLQVALVDVRILSYLPQPMEAHAIQQHLKGKVSLQQAKFAAAAAAKVYAIAQSFIEKNPPTNTTPDRDNNNGFLLAREKIQKTSQTELVKLKQLMGDVKQRLAGHSTSSGSESKELYDRVKNLVIEIGTTEESNSLIQQISTASRFESVTKHKEMIENVVSMLEKKSKQYQDQMDTDASTEFSLSSLASFLDPIQLLDRANDLMPSMSEKLVGYVEYMEQYHTGHKSLIKTDWILDKAKQYLETAESDEFKQSISTTMSNTQVQDLAEWGDQLSSDATARQQFVNQIKDQALDFIMDVLPSMNVPTISGIKDDVEYTISDLDLSNFRLKKEKVFVKLGAMMGADEIVRIHATDVWASMNGLSWSFKQTSFPYFSGSGTADATLTSGSIRLSFRAEKKKTQGTPQQPSLALAFVDIEITEELHLSVYGSMFSWVYNLLASIFTELIQDYIVTTLECTLIDHMTELLDKLNVFLKRGTETPYWPKLLHVARIDLETLPEAPLWRGAIPLKSRALEQELLIEPTSSRLSPLEECSVATATPTASPRASPDTKKILDAEEALKIKLNHACGFIIQKDVRSRHALVAKYVAKKSTPSFKGLSSPTSTSIPVGAQIVAINGLSVDELTPKEIQTQLLLLSEKLDGDPLTIRYRTDVLLDSTSVGELRKKKGRCRPVIKVIPVTFKEAGPMGLKLRRRPLCSVGAVISGFVSLPDGSRGVAEKDGRLIPGQVMLRINDEPVLHVPFQEILTKLKNTPRPMTIRFTENSDALVTLQSWPPGIQYHLEEIVFPGQNTMMMIVDPFTLVPVPSICSGKLPNIGHKLVQINDTLICHPWTTTLAQVNELVRSCSASNAKTRMVFSSVIESLDDRIEVVFPSGPVGLEFVEQKEEEKGRGTDESLVIVLKGFLASPGAAERSNLLYPSQRVLQIGEHTVPESGDVTPELIQSMIQRVTAPPYTLTMRDLDHYEELFHHA